MKAPVTKAGEEFGKAPNGGHASPEKVLLGGQQLIFASRHQRPT